jgi:hypothetical protein
MKNSVQTFAIKPAPRSATIFTAGLCLFFVADMFWLIKSVPGHAAIHVPIHLLIIGAMIYVATSMRKTRFEISSDGLRIHGDMFGQSLTWRDLDITNARIVQFQTEPGLKPKWKTMGTALPGYSAGWFRLYNKSKALVFLTDRTESVLIPTRKDFSVLLSSENNPALLEALKQGGKN